MNCTIICCMIIVCVCVAFSDAHVCSRKTLRSDFNKTEKFVFPTCRIAFIYLAEEISNLRCKNNYEHEVSAVIVKDGCQGHFVICSDRKSREVSKIVRCFGEGYTECNTGLPFVYSIELVDAVDFKVCIRNLASYGKKGNKVWINYGCQGNFMVHGVKNGC